MASQTKERRSTVFKNSSLRSRRIFVNTPPTPEYAHSTFVGNEVRRSKYTLLNFIPKNIYEQFNRFANFYFLSLVLLQTIPIFKEVDIIVAAAPVIIIVFTTGLRDGLEDYKRHQADKILNNRKVKVLDNFNQNHPKSRKFSKISIESQNPTSLKDSLISLPTSHAKWVEKTWAEVKVGDFIYLQNNDHIPADLAIVSSSELECTCFLETKNLDGETNLKIKKGVSELSYISTPDDCALLKCHVDAEMPNPNLYTFNGALSIPDFTKDEPNVIPIGPSEVALRGCVLRNTAWMIGLVLYTGKDTKIILNSGETPFKRSQMERQINNQIIMNCVILLCLCTVCGVLAGLNSHSIEFAYAAYADYDFRHFPSVFLSGLYVVGSSLIILQNIIPVALVIMSDLAKLQIVRFD